MAIEALDLLLKLATGGAAGYITNFLAIKMLVKKYPLIGGDILQSNSNQLKEGMSDIFTKDVISTKNLKPELDKNEFKSAFNDFSNEVNENLSNKLPDIELKVLPGFDVLTENFNNFFLNNDIFESIDLEQLLKSIGLEKILGSEQLKSFSTKAYALIMQSVNPELKDFLTAIYNDFKEKKITGFVTSDDMNKVSESLEQLIDLIKPKLIEMDAEIDILISDTLKVIELENILDKLETILKEKRIIDLIGEENKLPLTNELIQHFIVFIDSEEGKGFLKKLADNLINLTKNIDQSLLNFLNPILQVKMFNFIDSNLPYLAENAKEWLRINKKEIESLIENTIDEYYATQQGFMNQIKLTIKDLIGLKISEYFQIVEKGIERLENYINNSATKDLTEEVVGFLQDKQVGAIFTDLKINSDTLAKFFHQMVHQYLPKINISLFDSIFYKKLGDISGVFRVSLKEKFGNQINNFLVKQIKYQLFYNDKIFESLKELVKQKFEQAQNNNFESLLSKEKFDSYTGYLPILLMFSQGKVIDKILEEVKRQLTGKNLNDVINNDLKTGFLSNISELLKNNITPLTNHLKEFKLKDLNSQLAIKRNELEINKNDFSDNFALIIEKMLIKNTKSRINNLGSEQISKNIESVTENYIKSLSWSGALFGSGVGTLTYFSQFTGVNYYTTGNTALITIPVIYASMGIVTNWLAINSFLKPDIISKNKLSFASNLNQTFSGQVISNNLQNQNEHIKSYFSETDYQKLDITLANNIENLAEQLLSEVPNIIVLSLENNKSDIINKLSDKINQYELKNIEQESFNKIFDEVIHKTKGFVSNFINTKIESYREQNVGQVLSEKVKTEINNYVSIEVNKKITEYSQVIKDDIIERKIEEILSQLEEYLNFNVKIESFVELDKSAYFKNKIANYLNDLMKTKISEAIQKYIHQLFFEDELAPHKEIGSLFNGELITFARRNIYKGLDKIIFEFGLEKLKTEKEKISEKIISKVRESNKDSFLYGFGGSLLNIEEDIKNIIHLLIDDKLEPYLSDKKWELENILTGFVDFLARKKLEEIGLTEDILNSENTVILINKFLENENIKSSVNHLSVALIDDLMSFNLDFLLSLLGIKSLTDISGKFSNELHVAKNEIFVSLSNNHENMSKVINEFSGKIIDKLLYSLPIKPVLENIPVESIKSITDKIVNELYNSQSFVEYQNKFSEKIYQSLLEKKAGEIISTEILQKELILFIETFTKEESFKDNFKIYLKPLTDKLKSELKNIVPESTKDYIINLIVESIEQSFQNNSIKIIDSLNLKELIDKQLVNINSKDISDLFYQTTNNYLTKIILSGWLGGLAGIIAAIPTLK